MNTYKLTYFNARGRAEVCRLLFAVSHQDYEDHRIYDRTEWANSIKNTMPLGQVPVLTINGGTIIPQSRAIERYLAREFGLYGKNNIENTMCDVIIETIHNDFRPHIRSVAFESDESKKKELDKSLSEEIMPKFVKFIETKLKENGTGYFVGEKLTVADLAVYDILQWAKLLWSDKALLYSDKVAKHTQMIEEIPEVKQWIESRPQTER